MHSTHAFKTVPSFLVATLVALATVAPPANAALIVVDTLADGAVGPTDGACSLREALHAANLNTTVDGCTAGNTSNDLILFSLAGTITLTAGALGVTDDVVIATLAGTTIDAGYASRIFQVNMSNIADDFEIQGNGLVLRRGRAVAGNGGAVLLQQGDRALFSDIHFELNEACGAILGGACADVSSPQADGGAVYAGHLFDNVEIRDSTFVANFATTRGGAIAISGWNPNSGAYGAPSASVLRSHLIGNGIGSASTASRGAAIYMIGNGDAAFLFERSSAVLHWISPGGAGSPTVLNVGADVTMRNALVADNPDLTAAVIGGLSFDHGLDLSYSTITRNENGVSLIGSATARVLSSSISHNTTWNCGGPGSATLASGGYNHSDEDTTCPFDSVLDLPAGPALLSGLEIGNDGRPRVLPSVHSPLVDGGSHGGCSVFSGDPAMSMDLLGQSRPVDGDGDGATRCDVGAIELPAGSDHLFADGFESGTTSAWSS
jgi:CSLREA domain-containing protein